MTSPGESTHIDWHCHLIGRSEPCETAAITEKWNRIAAVAGFSSARDVPGMATMWHVDKLCSLKPFAPTTNVTVDAVLHPQGWKLDQGLGVLQKFPWLDMVQLKGAFVAGNSRTETPVLVTVTLFGDAPGALMTGALLMISDVTNGMPAADMVNFHRGILSVLGCEDAVEFDIGPPLPAFKVLRRQCGALSLLKIGWSAEERGQLQSSLTVAVPERESLVTALRKIAAARSGENLVWTAVSFRTRNNPAAWDEAFPWLNQQHAGSWIQWHMDSARDVWTPARVFEEGGNLDVIPVGRFTFPKGKRAASIPSALHGLTLIVDLFKEGSGWHFAFHTVEDEFTKADREAIRQALNSMLGGNFITRTPGSLWPEAYPF